MFKTLSISIAYIHCIISVLSQTNVNIDCNNAYECVGTEWVLSNDSNIYGYGYMSLYGANTSITAYNYVYCSGAFACTQISFITNTQYYAYPIYCQGSHSCANIDGLSYINAKWVECLGSNSCQNSNIRAGLLLCGGSQSCIHTNISAQYVVASGSYSLYASIIDSGIVSQQLVISNTSEVWLGGYQSGFGATIICRAGDICNIYCYYNGCEMLYVECEPNSYCNIILDNNGSTITVPPITNMNEYNYSLYDIKNDLNITVVNNQQCNKVSNFVYDNYYENTEQIQINEQETAAVCCRGCASCWNTESISFSDTVSDIVVCSGHHSCANTIINTTQPVYCEGYEACQDTFINKANNVYCLGSNACYDSVITEPTNVYCLGEDACDGSIIKSNGNDINVYLFGAHDMSWYRFGTDIYCDIGDICHIQCGGFMSCDYTTLHCDDNCFVVCNNHTVCPIEPFTWHPSGSPTAHPTANVDKSTRPNTIRMFHWIFIISICF